MDATSEVTALKRLHRLAKTDRLRELREEKGLYQADVARVLRVNRAQVSRWESGRQRPRGKHAVALLDLLEA